MLKLIIVNEQDPREAQKQAEREAEEAPGVIYIAGPITGRPDYIERFCRAYLDLEAEGWIILNPADLPEGMPADRYMPICLAMLQQADAVYMLEGWEESAGASIEWTLAKYQGKRVIYQAQE